MSISQRKFLALVVEYLDAGSTGEVDSAYRVKASPDSHQKWWCSLKVTGGHEVTTGMQPDHRQTAEIVFAAECPVAEDDGIRFDDGRTFIVRSLEPCEYGHNEIKVTAERTAELTLSAT